MADEHSKRIEKIRNRPTKCVFCGGGPKSREHVLPKWMKDYLPTGLNAHIHIVSRYPGTSASTVGGKSHFGKLHQAGDPRSAKLPTVCVSCNNGWMSALQEKSKPHLIPLLQQGKPNTDIAEIREILAAWATMFTMVWETADPESSGTSAAERSYFKQYQLPPEFWHVWIGKFDDSYGANSPTLHRLMRIAWSSPQTGHSYEQRIQVTLLGAANMYMQIISSDAMIPAGLTFLIEAQAQAMNIEKIWPNTVTGESSPINGALMTLLMDSYTSIITQWADNTRQILRSRQ